MVKVSVKMSLLECEVSSVGSDFLFLAEQKLLHMFFIT